MRLTAILVALAVLAGGLAGILQAESASPEAAQTPQTRLVLPQLARDGYPGTFSYTVQPGDTLFSIAQRFGTTVAVISALNGITDPSQIEAGWFLFIPEPAAPPGPSVVIQHGDRGTNRVALTFDMGGRLDPALDIVNWLIAHNIKATIFPTGSIVESPNTSIGRHVLQLVNAHPDLFELGNHSYSHPDFTTLSAQQIAGELAQTESAVAPYSSLTLKPRFRPPFGAYNAAVLQAVGAAGYRQTIMWDVDTIDWRPESEGGPTAAQIVSKVVNNAQGGSIVLMHLGGYNSYDALPQLIAGLQSRGFIFAKVSEVAGP